MIKPGSTGMMLTVDQCALMLKAIADHTRLRIMESLLVEKKCVSELVREFRCPQPHISHHLRILRDAGLIEGLRDGQQVCYRILPRIQRVLARRQGQALNFGCCELRFPAPVFRHGTRERTHRLT